MTKPCAIWGTRTYESGHDVNNGNRQYDCPRAGGQYEITGGATAALGRIDEREKAYLTTWLVDQRRLGNGSPVVDSQQIDSAKTATPLSIVERRDRLLLEIAAHTPALGQAMQYFERIIAWSPGEPPRENSHWAKQDALLAATESLTVKELKTLIGFGAKQGLIEESGSGISLTFDGYTHLEALRATRTSSLQAFVAMWFDREVSEAYEQGIAPAIADAGYRVMRIDRKEHNNKIDDEIIAEIRRSRFVVADFTCAILRVGEQSSAVPRGGVYYEAGFAQGLGIPVIWMCREDHIEHVHFDTRQFNHITWKGPDDLREKLRNRIGAVLGDGPLAEGAT